MKLTNQTAATWVPLAATNLIHLMTYTNKTGNNTIYTFTGSRITYLLVSTVGALALWHMVLHTTMVIMAATSRPTVVSMNHSGTRMSDVGARLKDDYESFVRLLTCRSTGSANW